MTTIRWILILVTAVASLGLAALMVIGGGFRKSFGASDEPKLAEILVIAFCAGLWLSLFLPSHRPLMHLVAVTVGLAAAGSVWILRESAFMGCLGLGYCGLWFGYYWMAVWSQSGTPTP